ncbi:MAG: hypothetical protein IKW02_01935 [Clostridia bacterium]|nr:hypothetical protein [Clostridia bacterium]
MKKMTKILSLVLALAMVLSMTALAGTPTKIIFSDDNSAASDLSLETWKTGRSELLTHNLLNGEGKASDFFGENATNTKYYYAGNIGATLSEKYGKTVLTTLSRTDAAYPFSIGYKLATPWSYTANKDRNVALVASLDMGIAYTFSSTTGQTTRKLITNFFNKATKDTENTEGDYAGWAVNEDGSLKLSESYYADDGYAFVKDPNTGVYSATDFYFPGNGGEHDSVVHKINEEYNLSTIYSCSSSTRIGKISMNDFSYFPTSNRTDWLAEEVVGIVFTPNKYQKIDFSGFMYYELSKDAKDLYIENLTNTDIALGEEFEIVLSQPIRKQEAKARFDKTVVNNVLADLVINDGEKDLVYNTDYTAAVSQRVVGDAVKGVITIKLNEMDFDTTYSVTLPSHTANIARVTMSSSNNHTATFTTEKAPTFDMNISANEGLNANGAAITADAMAGKTVYFTANATNITGRDVTGALAIGIYNGEGKLVKAAFANKAFANGGSNTFSAAFKMEAGYTAKAFVKDTVSEKVFGN